MNAEEFVSIVSSLLSDGYDGGPKFTLIEKRTVEFTWWETKFRWNKARPLESFVDGKFEISPASLLLKLLVDEREKYRRTRDAEKSKT